MLPQPAALDRVFEPGAELAATALQLEQERGIDPLDVDPAVLHRLDAGCELDELTRAMLAKPSLTLFVPSRIAVFAGPLGCFRKIG